MTAPSDQPPLSQRLAPSRQHRNNVHDPRSLVKVDYAVIDEMATSKKTFHCVADETVLIHNISTIKKWAATGAITLLVPLSAWGALLRQKKGSLRTNANARDAIRFVERAQSGEGENSAPRGVVRLQASTEQYATWAEAEKAFLPDSDVVGQNGLSNRLERQLDVSDKLEPTALRTSSNDSETSTWRSAPTNVSSQPTSLSPAGGATASHRDNGVGAKQTSGRGRGHKRQQSSSALGVPAPIQGLLNCVLWQLHESPEKFPETNSLILLTNDQKTQGWAQQFGVNVNRVGQLDHLVRLEEKDLQNRMKLSGKTEVFQEPDFEKPSSRGKANIPKAVEMPQAEPEEPAPRTESSEDNSDSEEEVIVFQPRSSRSPQKPSPSQPSAQAPATLTPFQTPPRTPRQTTPNGPSQDDLNDQNVSSKSSPLKNPTPRSTKTPPKQQSPVSFGETDTNTKAPPTGPSRGGRGRGGGRPRRTSLPSRQNGKKAGSAPANEDVDFKLISGTPRNAARGRGKLWVG
ncbi:MAG: hypothetical protein M4579_004237 [Chaenotheca gracillima]|nr:MAG: hypothetical protein M4579_004237 [Chaenotheca gracillima]